ncbi:MAG: hypothetical protein WAT39_15685 [Planctomycetota bacterium]
MTDTPFHLTIMGKRFFEGTVPALVEAIERLNDKLDARPAAPASNPTAIAEAPTAASLVQTIEQAKTALAEILWRVSIVESAYGTTKAIRDAFDHNEAGGGFANLRHYLEQASEQAQRILRARK